MKKESHRLLRASQVAGIAARAALITALFAGAAVPGEIPPAVEKKAAALSHSRVMAEQFFNGNCGKCHAVPDPARPLTPKPGCTRGIPELGAGMVRDYMAEVRIGKGLYESHCGRCHPLIDPGAHSAEYWSKNLCTSEECFIQKLTGEEEQKVLLYLSAHADKKQ